MLHCTLMRIACHPTALCEVQLQCACSMHPMAASTAPTELIPLKFVINLVIRTPLGMRAEIFSTFCVYVQEQHSFLPL